MQAATNRTGDTPLLNSNLNIVFLSVNHQGTMIAGHTFPAAYQVFLESRQGKVGLLTSKASNRPFKIWFAVQVFLKNIASVSAATTTQCISLCDWRQTVAAMVWLALPSIATILWQLIFGCSNDAASQFQRLGTPTLNAFKNTAFFLRQY